MANLPKSGGPTISQQKILAAANGDQSALLEVLTQMAQVSAQQQSTTGTTPATGSAPVVSSTAKTPPQATGSVSALAGTYTLQIVTPASQSPISQLQAVAAAQTQAAQPLTTTIFHQIRVSTSPAFNVNSNTQTFGGTTGSPQTLWTFTNLGSGTWYFQFRSSYDGVNFNTWKNANSGTGIGGLISEVTVIPVPNANWALFPFPGEIMGVFEAFLEDQGQLNIPAGFNLFSSGLLGVAGPDGFSQTGQEAFGIIASDLDVQVPTSGDVGVIGVPDFPVLVAMKYGQRHNSNVWSGTVTAFGVAFNPVGTNVTLYEEGGTNGAVWAVFTLPGGCPIALGQGRNSDGAPIWLPPSLPWISASRMISLPAVTAAADTGNGPHGIFQNQISGGIVEAKYNDGSTTWSTEANWFAIAWAPGANVFSFGGTQFIEIALQGGHKVAFGGGQVASGTAITLPAGYSEAQMLSGCTPASFNDAGHVMAGFGQCSFVGLTPFLQYLDPSNDAWDGNVNYMIFVWQ